HGRGLCREPLLLGCGDLDGPVYPLPQPGILLAKRLVFPGQLFAGRASGALGLNRAVDLSGLIINSLTATVDSACLDGNGTANAAETGGCIRDPKRNGYGTHGGWASVKVGLWLLPLFRTTPPSDQEEPGKSLPSVKLKNANLPGFGTVPFHALTQCQRWHRLAAFTFMAATQVHFAQANHHVARATCRPPYPTPSSATRNWVHFACMICYEMLCFRGVSRNRGEPSFSTQVNDG